MASLFAKLKRIEGHLANTGKHIITPLPVEELQDEVAVALEQIKAINGLLKANNIKGEPDHVALTKENFLAIQKAIGKG